MANEKKIDTIFWMITLLATVCLGVCGYLTNTVSAHEARIAVQDARQNDVIRRLERIESKLDQLGGGR